MLQQDKSAELLLLSHHQDLLPRPCLHISKLQCISKLPRSLRTLLHLLLQLTLKLQFPLLMLRLRLQLCLASSMLEYNFFVTKGFRYVEADSPESDQQQAGLPDTGSSYGVFENEPNSERKSRLELRHFRWLPATCPTTNWISQARSNQ